MQGNHIPALLCLCCPSFPPGSVLAVGSPLHMRWNLGFQRRWGERLTWVSHQPHQSLSTEDPPKSSSVLGRAGSIQSLVLLLSSVLSQKMGQRGCRVVPSPCDPAPPPQLLAWQIPSDLRELGPNESWVCELPVKGLERGCQKGKTQTNTHNKKNQCLTKMKLWEWPC